MCESIAGPGIDHGEFFFPDEVGIGAGPGHHPGIRRDQPRDMAVEALRHAGDQVVARLPALLGIAPVDLEVRRVAAPEDAARPRVPGPSRRGWSGISTRLMAYSKAVRGSAKRAKSASVWRVAWTSSISPRVAALERLVAARSRGGGPSRRRRARLPGPAGARATKKRVSKRRERPGCGDPVAVVGERAGGNVQVLALEQLEERARALVHEAAARAPEAPGFRSRRRRAARRPPRSTRVPRRRNRRARRSRVPAAGSPAPR